MDCSRGCLRRSELRCSGRWGLRWSSSRPSSSSSKTSSFEMEGSSIQAEKQQLMEIEWDNLGKITKIDHFCLLQTKQLSCCSLFLGHLKLFIPLVR
ncbi:hypothetical protein J5N97_006409 [Dioscorea zingiberensis]|uniref:Uncharacterized protein n=1 Tax=Dioscorea zingiberensis TaxID=325984 RepID=A0A9D5HTI9_9LILI|nr:hypothetical protein J5N97_006409 [Dioscorea zingiberensis]